MSIHHLLQTREKYRLVIFHLNITSSLMVFFRLYSVQVRMMLLCILFDISYLKKIVIGMQKSNMKIIGKCKD